MNFTFNMFILYLFVIHITIGISIYYPDILRVIYWPFYEDKYVLGSMLLILLVPLFIGTFIKEDNK